MTALQITGLILFIVSLAGVLGYLFQAGNNNTDDQEPYINPTYTKEELENIKAAEEAYNKPAPPKSKQPALTAEQLPDSQPAFPHTTKTIQAEELNVIQPEFVAKVVETAKVFPSDAAINAETLVAKATGTDEVQVVEKVKETKSEFPIDKPKKKRKSHAKNKK